MASNETEFTARAQDEPTHDAEPEHAAALVEHPPPPPPPEGGEPGWYTDHEGVRRYWDGERWTEIVWRERQPAHASADRRRRAPRRVSGFTRRGDDQGRAGRLSPRSDPPTATRRNTDDPSHQHGPRPHVRRARGERARARRRRQEAGGHDAAVHERLPDKAQANFAPTAGQAIALRTIQAQIGEYVEKSGPKFSFATHFDSSEGQIVIDSDAPRDLLAKLTSVEDKEGREAIAKAKVTESKTEDTWHRRDDIQAFWGGAGITNGSGICSAGYAVRSATGAVSSVTAGHCFANGTNALVESGLRSYGTVSARRLPTVTGHRWTWSWSAVAATPAASTPVA